MGRDQGELYRGARLAAALDWSDDRVDLTSDRTGLPGGERRCAGARAPTMRGAVPVVCGSCSRASSSLLALALVAGAVALVQRGHARHTATVAQAGRLAAESREVAAKHPDLALLLALEAGRLDDSVDSRGALLGALEHGSRIRAWLQGFDSPVVATAFNPRRHAPRGHDHRGDHALRHGVRGTPARPPLRSAQGGSSGVDFSPDGRTLAIAGGEGRVELWDVATRKELRELTDPAAGLRRARARRRSVQPGRQRHRRRRRKETNHVTLWAAATGRLIGPADHRQAAGVGGAQSISFSPDSKRIAVPGRPRDRWDLGGRHGAPGRNAARDRERTDVEAAIFAEGGRTLIASDDSGSVSFVDIRNRATDPPAAVGRRRGRRLAGSQPGRTAAGRRPRSAGSVFVWNAKTGEPYGSPLTADTSPVSDVAFSPDGRTLVSAHLRSAVVWSMSGEQAIGEPLDGGPI